MTAAVSLTITAVLTFITVLVICVVLEEWTRK